MICTKCGLPQELCVCEKLAKETQQINVYIERKKFNKVYTIIKGIQAKDIDMKDLLKKLKGKLACGGTIKENTIELQGDHKYRVKQVLIGLGFAGQMINLK